jgi:hypothetical protein
MRPALVKINEIYHQLIPCKRNLMITFIWVGIKLRTPRNIVVFSTNTRLKSFGLSILLFIYIYIIYVLLYLYIICVIDTTERVLTSSACTKCFFQLLIPEFTLASLLESEPGCEIVNANRRHRKTTIFTPIGYARERVLRCIFHDSHFFQHFGRYHRDRIARLAQHFVKASSQEQWMWKKKLLHKYSHVGGSYEWMRGTRQEICM